MSTIVDIRRLKANVDENLQNNGKRDGVENAGRSNVSHK
jgi:hypothetical protein